MNKQQKEVQQQYLNNEKAVLKKLEANYRDALAEINSKIELLMARQDADMQHVIYQVEYQKALKTQVQAILETLQANEFETVSEYLTQSYEDGFIGTMYDLQGQGIPLIFPIDQEQVVQAIQTETKLSENLYTEMGHDIKDLQKKISGEISRGLSSGQTYSEITRNIASWARIPKNRAMTIARTEAHRIQNKAGMNACNKAKSKGADVVKQWDATLDSKTRDSHAKIDGEIRELDEKFSNGLEYPGEPKGRPEEVINCRCILLQRARWALGNDYTKWSEDAPVVVDDDGTTQFAIIKAKNFDDFKKQYKQASKGLGTGENTIVKDHAKPEYIKTIDIKNKKAVEKELLDFENESIHEKIETACVITNDGKVYRCFGVEDGVFPDYDLGEEIRGAYISHNHPESKTEYSFGKSDFELFCQYELEELRGFDVKYSYKFDRHNKKRDARKDLFDMTDEDWQHDESIKRAEMIDVGYTRVKK